MQKQAVQISFLGVFIYEPILLNQVWSESGIWLVNKLLIFFIWGLFRWFTIIYADIAMKCEVYKNVFSSSTLKSVGLLDYKKKKMEGFAFDVYLLTIKLLKCGKD